MASLTRRNFLRGLAGTFVLAGATGAYARFGEPHWLEVNRLKVQLLKGEPAKRPIVALHLSDLHDSPVVALDYIERAIRLGLAQRPDIIFVTGDFITLRFSDPARFIAILARLPATAPTFACLGNHDGGPWTRRVGGYTTDAEVREVLAAAQVTCLRNEGQEIFVNGRALQVTGVGDLWSGQCDPGVAFARTPPRGTAGRILLNHNPDAKNLARPHDWDLMLSGHTHGGQLRIPLIGTPYAPVSDKRYVEGMHRWEERWLHVTRGVGNLHGVRFNCRPQVSVIELS